MTIQLICLLNHRSQMSQFPLKCSCYDTKYFYRGVATFWKNPLPLKHLADNMVS